MITVHIPEDQVAEFLDTYPESRLGSLTPAGTRRVHIDSAPIGDVIANHPIVKAMKAMQGKCSQCEQEQQALNSIPPSMVDKIALSDRMLSRAPWVFRLPVVRTFSKFILRNIILRKLTNRASTVK